MKILKHFWRTRWFKYRGVSETFLVKVRPTRYSQFSTDQQMKRVFSACLMKLKDTQGRKIKLTEAIKEKVFDEDWDFRVWVLMTNNSLLKIRMDDLVKSPQRDGFVKRSRYLQEREKRLNHGPQAEDVSV
jgi:hypothetical protein